MTRTNPWNPTGALDHTASATPDLFFSRDQLAQLMAGFTGGTPVGGIGQPGAMMASGIGGAGRGAGYGSAYGGGYGGAGGYGGIPNSAVQAIQAKIDESNKANEQRYTQGLGVIDQGKNDTMSMLNNLFGQILGAGTDPTPALNRESKNAANELGTATTSLTSRGLGNSNLLTDVQRGVADDSATRNQEIYNNANQQQNNWRAQLAQMMMGMYQNYTGAKSNFIQARSDNPPDLSELARLYSQPGATGNYGLGNSLYGRGAYPGQVTQPISYGGFSQNSGSRQGTSGGAGQLAIPQTTFRPPAQPNLFQPTQRRQSDYDTQTPSPAYA